MSSSTLSTSRSSGSPYPPPPLDQTTTTSPGSVSSTSIAPSSVCASLPGLRKDRVRGDDVPPSRPQGSNRHRSMPRDITPEFGRSSLKPKTVPQPPRDLPAP